MSIDGIDSQNVPQTHVTEYIIQHTPCAHRNDCPVLGIAAIIASITTSHYEQAPRVTRQPMCGAQHLNVAC
jgi:hypothetical protein